MTKEFKRTFQVEFAAPNKPYSPTKINRLLAKCVAKQRFIGQIQTQGLAILQKDKLVVHIKKLPLGGNFV